MTEGILRPFSVERDDGWAPNGAATLPLAADLVNEIPTHDDDSSYASIGSGGTTPELGFRPDPNFPLQIASINTLSVAVRARHTSGSSTNNRVLVTLNSTDVYSSVFSLDTGWTSITRALSRPGGGSWTEADLRDPSFGFGFERENNGPATRITSSWVALDFVAQAVSFTLSPYRELAARQIRIFQNTPETYRVVVPYGIGLGVDLMDETRLHHDAITRAATLLDALATDGMREIWRGMYSRIVSIDDDLDRELMTIEILNEEPIACISWDTLAAPFDVNSDESVGEISQRRLGIASLNAGATRKEDRPEIAWIEDSSNRFGHVRLAKVVWGVAKANNFGTLAEDAIGNDVLNSCFIDDTAGAPDGWTIVTGTGGAVSISTDHQLFEDIELGQQVVKITKGSAGDVYMERSFSTTATDRRINTWAIKGDVVGQWAYQRNNGDWRNDSTESWSASIVWNTLANNSDEWTRTIAKLVTGQGAGTGSLRIGLGSGLENDHFYVGQVMSYEDERIFSDVLTDNSAVVSGGDADTIHDEIDNGGADDRQVCNPERGTYRVTMRAYQDEDGVLEGVANRLIIRTFRWNADGDRIEVALEKVSGQVRVAARLFRSSTEEALAFKSITLVREQEYEIAASWTSPSDGENGLAARTYSVYVDGAKGTDDVGDGILSTSQQVTQGYIGSTTSGVGLRRCANYLRNDEVLQRVLAPEEVLGRRPD